MTPRSFLISFVLALYSTASVASIGDHKVVQLCVKISEHVEHLVIAFGPFGTGEHRQEVALSKDMKFIREFELTVGDRASVVYSSETDGFRSVVSRVKNCFEKPCYSNAELEAGVFVARLLEACQIDFHGREVN